MSLRPYQQEALEAIKKDLSVSGASIVCLPMGSGKSHVIAETATLAHTVLILQPSTELVIQNKEKLLRLVDEKDIGVFCATAGKREVRKFTFATIQSVYKKPERFKDVDLIIIDECHAVGVTDLYGMFTRFLAHFPNVKVFGFTATPFRIDTVYERKQGMLFARTGIKMINRMRNKKVTTPFWKRIIYTVPHQRMVDEKYLVPLTYIHEPLVPYEHIPVNVSHSDFNLQGYSEMIIGMESNILNTISEAQKRYTSVLVFCADVPQAARLSEIVKGSGFVTGATKPLARKMLIEKFKNGEIKTLFNVSVLTTGFDHPQLDCIILLRPVRSPLLYLQMLGRGSRTVDGKTTCTVIDFTGSCKALGSMVDSRKDTTTNKNSGVPQATETQAGQG